MQTAAAECFTALANRRRLAKLYGIDDPATADYGTRCLIARRLIERGVRFVQLFTRNEFWTTTVDPARSLPAACSSPTCPCRAVKGPEAARPARQHGRCLGGEMGAGR